MHAREHVRPVVPSVDPPPEPGPGGVDAVEPEREGPMLTPDPPRLVIEDG